MSKFIFSYRSPKTHDWLADPDGLNAWNQFLTEVVGPKAVDMGWPSFEPTTIVGETGDTTLLGGYSIIEADDVETATAMAQQCPTVERGGGVEVAVLADLPPEHPAEQIRQRQAAQAA